MEPKKELAIILADLRHAYAHLVNGRVLNYEAFADGLIAPQIKRLEKLLERMNV